MRSATASDALTTESGKRIKAERIAKGWSLRELGGAAGLDFGYVGKVERGEAVGATIETFGKLADALGLTFHPSLFAGSVRSRACAGKRDIRVLNRRKAQISRTNSRERRSVRP